MGVKLLLKEKRRDVVYRLRVQTGYRVGDPVDYELGAVEDLETAQRFLRELEAYLIAEIHRQSLDFLVEVAETEEDDSHGWQGCVELVSKDQGVAANEEVCGVLSGIRLPGGAEIKSFGGGVRIYAYRDEEVIWGLE